MEEGLSLPAASPPWVTALHHKNTGCPVFKRSQALGLKWPLELPVAPFWRCTSHLRHACVSTQPPEAQSSSTPLQPQILNMQDDPTYHERHKVIGI